MRIGLYSNAHSGTREACENIEDCRSILVIKLLDFLSWSTFFWVGWRNQAKTRHYLLSSEDEEIKSFIQTVWGHEERSLKL